MDKLDLFFMREKLITVSENKIGSIFGPMFENLTCNDDQVKYVCIVSKSLKILSKYIQYYRVSNEISQHRSFNLSGIP